MLSLILAGACCAPAHDADARAALALAAALNNPPAPAARMPVGKPPRKVEVTPDPPAVTAPEAGPLYFTPGSCPGGVCPAQPQTFYPTTTYRRR